MVKTVNDELSTAKKELWNMKVELKRLKDIAFLVKDQINRLQVEELSLQSMMVSEDVGNSVTYMGSSPAMGSQAATNQDSVHEVNSINLDLSVLPSGSGSQDTNQFNNETSWEEEDEDSNECVLNL